MSLTLTKSKSDCCEMPSPEEEVGTFEAGPVSESKLIGPPPPVLVNPEEQSAN